MDKNMKQREFWKTKTPTYVKGLVYAGGAACVFMGVVYCVMGLMGIFFGLLWFLLAYGIFARRSRVCAVVAGGGLALLQFVGGMALRSFAQNGLSDELISELAAAGMQTEQIQQAWGQLSATGFGPESFLLIYILIGLLVLGILGTFQFQSLWEARQRKDQLPPGSQDQQ